MRMHDLKIEMEAGEIWGRRHGVPPEQRFYGPGGDTGASVQSAGGNYTALLDALIQGLPQTLSAEQTYGPGFTEAGLVNTGTELKGTATTPGYLSLYQNNVAPVLNATTATANTSARTANLADLTKLGGGAADAIAGIDPATAALSKSLTGTAQSQLNAGTAIDPFTMDNTINSVLGAYSNRGLGTSPGAQLGLSTTLATGGQNLLQQREQTASGVINQNMANYTDPILAMLGINSNTPSAAASKIGRAHV